MWLIRVQGPAMQEVVLILPGEGPIFYVDLLELEGRLFLGHVHHVLLQEGERCGRPHG